MNCAEVFECLPLLDRDDLDPAERSEVLRHADACPACADELEAVRSTVFLLREGTSDLLSDPPTAGELAEMIDGVSREAPRRRAGLVAAAAAIALAAGAFAFFLPAGDGDEEPPTGPATQQEPAPVPPEEEKKPETEKPPVPKPEEEKKPAPPKEDVEFSLELRMKAAMHLKNTREWAKAGAAFEEIARRCGTDEEKRKYGAPALLLAGECLYCSDRFLEAYETYDRIVRAYRKLAPDQAADAAYYRYRAAAALDQEKRTKESRQRKHDERLRFWREFPNHPRALDLGYYSGADAIHAGDALSVSGHAEKAAEEYRKAIDVYLGTITRKSTLYLKAQARIGEVKYKLGRYDEALTVFAKVLDREKRLRTTDPQRLASRNQAEAIAAYWGALCHEKKGEWGKLLEILTNFERLGDELEVRLFAFAVTRKRSEALAALGRTDEAIAEIGKLGEKKMASDLARLGLLLEKLGKLEQAEKALVAALAMRKQEEKNRRVRKIRDAGGEDTEVKAWQEALKRVKAARKR